MSITSINKECHLNVQLPCKYVGKCTSVTPETLRINSQTPVFLNRTIFDGLTVSKMASVFVASLRCSTQAILNKNMLIHNYRRLSKQNTASFGFASHFELLHGRRAPRKQTRMNGSQAYILYCIHTLKLLFMD